MNNLKALLTQFIELECEQIIIPILLLSELKPASYVFSPLYNVVGGGFYLLQSFIRPHINFFEVGIQDWTQIILLALILETYLLISLMAFVPLFKVGAIGQIIKTYLSYIITIAKYPFFQCIYECFIIIIFFEKNIVISILGLVFSLFLHLIILIFCKQSLHLNGIINLTSLWYICQFLGFVQIIIFVSFKDKGTAQQIQSICSLIIGLLSLFQVIYQKSIFNQTQRLIVIFANSINVFIGFEYLLQIDSYIYKNMWIIMTPLIYQSIRSKDEDLCNKILLIHNMNQLSQLKYFCAQIIDFDRDSSQNQIIKELFKINHQQKCNSKTCGCQTEPFGLKFVIQSVNEQFQKIIDQNKGNNDQIYLSYLQFLQETDQVIMAYQLSKQILEYKDKSKKKRYDSNSRKMKVSFITHLYVQILHYIIISKIIIRVSQVSQTKQSDNHNLLSVEIQKFIDTEIQKVEVIKNLISILNNKIEYLTLQSQILDDQSLYDKSTKLIEQIDLFYKVLQYNYQKYQTTKNRNILMFYQVEIQNDLIKAYSLEESSPFANEIFQMIDHSDMLNNFSNQYYYIITRIHSPKNIEISNVSKNFKNIMKQNLLGMSINELIPEYVSKFHHEYVIKFFEEGKNRYFQQFSQLYVMINKGIVTPIEIAMDVDQNDKSCLSMILLFKLSENNLPTLFVDQDLQLSAMSLNLYCDILGMNINSAHKYFDHLQVSKVIPNFNQYIQAETLVIKNCSFYFPNSEREAESNWGSKSSVIKYTCNLQITKMIVNESCYYYQVIVDNLKNKNSRKSETLIITPYLQEVAVKSDLDHFDEEIKIEYPKGEDVEEIMLITNRDTQAQQMLYSAKNDNLIEEKHLNLGSKGNDKNDDNQQQIMEKFNQAAANQNKFDDGASQVTSVAQVKSSPFFKKYQLINNLINSQIQSKYMNRVSYLIVIFGILSIINMGLIIQETTLLERFKSDIKILSIKYDVYGPFEDFLVTRYTIVNYNSLLSSRTINQTLWNFYVIFPRSNLALGYDDVKSNILTVLDEYSFQDYIKDKVYTIYLYNRTNIGYERNMSFRTAVSLFLNYQYEYKLAYTIKPLFTDSPYSYFTYQNYFTLYNSFTDLNQFVLDQTLYLSSYYLDQALILEIPFIICVLIVYLMIIHQYFQYQQVFNKLYVSIKNTDKTSVTLEIKRLKGILNEIKSNEEYVYQYKLDIYIREQQLKDQEHIHKQNNCDIRIKNENLYIYQKIGYIFTSFSLILYIGIGLGASFMIVNYYQKYGSTARFYHKLSQVGVDVPTAFAQREVLYYRGGFPFLSAQYITDVYSQIDTCLLSMSEFSQIITQFDSSKYLFNEQGIQLLQNINQDSLCLYLNANFTIKSASICANVLNGTLGKGLSASLIYMVNQVQTEKLNTNFMPGRRQQNLPVLELEGATLISNVINNVNVIMRNFIIDITDQLQNLITLLCALFIIIQFIIILFGITQLREYERIKFCKLKKFVLLIPQNTLLFDDSFSRQVRLACQLEKIY